MAIPLLMAIGAGLLSGISGNATEALLEKFYSTSEENDELDELERLEDEEEEV